LSFGALSEGQANPKGVLGETKVSPETPGFIPLP